MKTRRYKGFTLIEILVALSIITAILLLALTKYPLQSAKSKADADKTASVISCWNECVGFYKAVKGDYPDSLSDAENLGQCLCSDLPDLSYHKDTDGIYFCYSKTVSGIYDKSFLNILKRETGGILNTTCPADSDSDINVGQTAYLTVWLSK